VSRQANRILGVVFLVVGVEHIEEGAGVLTSKELTRSAPATTAE
jgi:hypothetical protein